MPESAEQKALRVVRRAQANFERDQERLQEERSKSRERRRKAFARAQSEGLTLRQIGEAVDMHHSRVSEIIGGE